MLNSKVNKPLVQSRPIPLGHCCPAAGTRFSLARKASREPPPSGSVFSADTTRPASASVQSVAKEALEEGRVKAERWMRGLLDLESNKKRLGNSYNIARLYLQSCFQILPEFVYLKPVEALRLVGLTVVVMLSLMVVLTTIDSAMLYAYITAARRLA